MKIYVTIRTRYLNDDDMRISKYILTKKWDENTFIEGHRKDDFDWKRNENNKHQFFGVNIYDSSTTASVYVCGTGV